MPWLFFAIAAALLGVALTSTSMAIMVVCILISLALTVVSVMSLIAERVGSASRSEAMLIDPHELRRLRELAEARRNAGTPETTTATPVTSEPPQA